jgi:hypothetical protein
MDPFILRSELWVDFREFYSHGLPAVQRGEEKHTDQLGRSSEQDGSRQDSLPCRNCNWGTLRSPRGLLYISMFVSPRVCRASSA